MNIFEDHRTVMTLDAGGTNFVFSALQGGKEIIESVKLQSYADDRERSLKTIIQGLEEVQEKLDESPVAISFAFPGPADYPRGIIDNISNLPGYAGGVALGPMLEDTFNLPVFINNDGDLFAYGEAMAGLLPEINHMLKEKGITKRYKNLFGVTVGTGFGGGTVIDGRLLQGDNSAAGEIWATRNVVDPHLTAEEGVSIRAVQHYFRMNDPGTHQMLSPKEVYEIARGRREGNRRAAILAYEKMGTVMGEALAEAITLIDGAMVIGGGISGAADLFLPKVVEQLNSSISGRDGKEFSRLVSKVYNIEDPQSAENFYCFKSQKVTVPFSEKEVDYVAEKRLPIGVSRLGTSQATALGAYAFALDQLE